MGARKAPTIVGTFQKAKGPASVAADPDHGSNHPTQDIQNMDSDITTPIAGASVRSWPAKVGGLECALRTVFNLATLACEISVSDLRVQRNADGQDIHILPAKTSDQITALLNAIEDVSRRELEATR